MHVPPGEKLLSLGGIYAQLSFRCEHAYRFAGIGRINEIDKVNVSREDRL